LELRSEVSMNRRRAVPLADFLVAGVLIAGVLALGLSTGPAQGQSKQDKKAEAELRTIHGQVLDKDENPAPSSVVYLLNRKTQAIRTYIADSTGNYRFSGLDPNADYEAHAEQGDLISPTRAISSFDSRRDMELTFRLTHKKAAK
jgi:hypothetical protein